MDIEKLRAAVRDIEGILGEPAHGALGTILAHARETIAQHDESQVGVEVLRADLEAYAMPPRPESVIDLQAWDYFDHKTPLRHVRYDD